MTVEVPIKEVELQKVELPSGKVAMIEPCLGKHIRIASSMTNSDQSLFMPAIMSQLVTIDGAKLAMEQFDEMPASDYMELMQKVSAGLGDFT